MTDLQDIENELAVMRRHLMDFQQPLANVSTSKAYEALLATIKQLSVLQMEVSSSLHMDKVYGKSGHYLEGTSLDVDKA